LDNAYFGLNEKLDVERQTVARSQENRRTLIASMVLAWFDLIAIKLHLVNVDDAAELINEIMRAMDDPVVYAQFRAQWKQREAVTEDYSKRLLPLHAEQSANEALQHLEKVQKLLEKIGLTPTFQAEIQALLTDEFTYFRISHAAATRVVQTKLDEYFRERQRQVKIISNRNAERMNQECKDLSATLLNGKQADLQSEVNYLTFRKKCT
jgi:hypothetical protein